MRRTVVAVSVVVVVAAGCGGPPAPNAEREEIRTSLPPETLLIDTVAGPLAVRTPRGAVLSSFPGAVRGAGGSLVYATAVEGGSTFLRTLDGRSGEAASQVRVRGEYRLGIVSGSGHAAALTEPLPEGHDPWVPIPRGRTEIVVADPTGAGEPRRFTLEGNYEPEAFSTDDRTLFLIQHLPALRPEAYRVTLLDLASGRVRPAFGPFKAPSERMPGIRLQQLWSPNGHQLYTLYSSIRPGYAPHDAPVASDAAVSFVHVLDLQDGWAHCVGLPEPMWDRPSALQAMAASPDGMRLYVVDAGVGLVAVMDTGSLQVRDGRVDLGANGPIDRTVAITSGDGATLFVATSRGSTSEIAAVDVGTFAVEDRWSVSGSVTTLGLSSDGTRLYAAVGDRLVAFDTRTGARLGTVPLAPPAEVTAVLPIAA